MTSMKKTVGQTGEWFQSRLDALGLSQTQFSEKTGITQAAVSRYKSQKQFPRITELDVLAEALGCNVLELLIGLGAIDPDAPTTPKVTKSKNFGRVKWSEKG